MKTKPAPDSELRKSIKDRVAAIITDPAMRQDVRSALYNFNAPFIAAIPEDKLSEFSVALDKIGIPQLS